MATNHFITLQKGIDMTTLYREQKENILGSSFRDQNILPLNETFDRTAIDTILQEDGCTAVRIYYGMSEDLKVHAILVGVNENNEDILPSPGTAMRSSEASDRDDDDNVIVEQSIRCPEDCGPSSPLSE